MTEPNSSVLDSSRVVYVVSACSHVHGVLGETWFDTWEAANEAHSRLPYEIRVNTHIYEAMVSITPIPVRVG